MRNLRLIKDVDCRFISEIHKCFFAKRPAQLTGDRWSSCDTLLYQLIFALQVASGGEATISMLCSASSKFVKGGHTTFYVFAHRQLELTEHI